MKDGYNNVITLNKCLYNRLYYTRELCSLTSLSIASVH
jgi:hypothetical protein